MHDRILIPTDGSEAGERAVEQAVEFARETDAILHALFVLEDASYAPEMIDETVAESVRGIGEDAVESIRERAEAAGVEVRTSIEEGEVHETILAYAEQEDCDLIVMGTHGRSGLGHYLLGSVAERVVRTSEIPVLTVRNWRGDRR